MEKSTKYLVTVASMLAVFFVSLHLVSAQDGWEGEEYEPPATLTVTGGKVEVESVSYPVYKKVKEVEEGQFGGIRYLIPTKSEKAALSLAKKIIKFYKGKKVNGAKLPKFVQSSKPDTTAWYSFKCTGEDESSGIQVIVKVEYTDVVVYVFPNCSEGMQAFIL